LSFGYLFFSLCFVFFGEDGSFIFHGRQGLADIITRYRVVIIYSEF